MTAGYSASGLHVLRARVTFLLASEQFAKRMADDVDTSAERANTNAEWLRDGTQSLQKSLKSSNDLPVSRSQIALMDQVARCDSVLAATDYGANPDSVDEASVLHVSSSDFDRAGVRISKCPCNAAPRTRPACLGLIGTWMICDIRLATSV